MSVSSSFKTKLKFRQEPPQRVTIEEWRYPRIDPIVHAWRACSPLTLIPVGLGTASRPDNLLDVQTEEGVDSSIEGVDVG